MVEGVPVLGIPTPATRGIGTMDLAQLPGLWSLTPYGAVLGMLVLMFYLTGTGKYIPRSSHERELAAANKRGDEWKEVSMAKDVQIEVLGAQNTVLIETTKTNAEFFGTIQREGGGRNVAQASSPDS